MSYANKNLPHILRMKKWFIKRATVITLKRLVCQKRITATIAKKARFLLFAEVTNCSSINWK